MTNEHEMIKPLVTPVAERDTSLQATYEDSVPPDEEERWEREAS